VPALVRAGASTPFLQRPMGSHVAAAGLVPFSNATCARSGPLEHDGRAAKARSLEVGDCAGVPRNEQPAHRLAEHFI
jgi:hypothetical protein